MEILIRGLVFNGCHGCTAEEKGRVRRFLVDIAIEADVQPVLWSDKPRDTVDWDPVKAIAQQVITGEPKNTVEWLAGQVAIRILRQDRRVTAVTVTVCKPEEWEDGNGVPGASVRLQVKDLHGTCMECGAPAVWVRQTQFSGAHHFCQTDAEAQPGFGQQDSSYSVWRPLAS